MINAINCASTVAAAAPHVPVFHTATNKISPTIFNPTEIARISNGVISVLRNVMQGMGDRVTPLISSGLEMVGKVVIAATLVPWLAYTGVIIAEPIVWFIMVIPLIVEIRKTPLFEK